MTALAERPIATVEEVPRRRVVGALAYSVLLLPLGLLALTRQALGRRRAALDGWTTAQRRLLGRPVPTTATAPATGRGLAHTAASLLLGAVGLIEAGLVALFVARGALYGVVDDGPYTDSWGGPSLAGAWTVHAAIGLGGLVVVAIVGVLVSHLHMRLTSWLRGRPVGTWVLPATVAVCAVAAIFVAAFVRQL